MQKLYTASNIVEANHLQALLQASRIQSELRNTYSSSAFGEIPLEDSLPQIWVKPVQLQLARQILDEALQSLAEELASWQCPQCNEDIDGVYAQCWNCGYAA